MRFDLAMLEGISPVMKNLRTSSETKDQKHPSTVAIKGH